MATFWTFFIAWPGFRFFNCLTAVSVNNYFSQYERLAMTSENQIDIAPVYSASDSGRAQWIRQLLESNGIEAFVAGDHQAGLPGLGILKIEVMVRTTDFENATKIIAELESESTDDSTA